jgi:hypothetical protein
MVCVLLDLEAVQDSVSLLQVVAVSLDLGDGLCGPLGLLHRCEVVYCNELRVLYVIKTRSFDQSTSDFWRPERKSVRLSVERK